MTVHHDSEHRARVLFAINPHPRPLSAEVQSFGANRAEDLLDGSVVPAAFSTFSFPVAERSVRIFKLA